MSDTDPAQFRGEPHPDHPGWNRFDVSDPTQYNSVVLGELLVRAEGDDRCRLRLVPRAHHLNMGGHIHGGVTLGLIDVSLFAALSLLRGLPTASAVTLDTQTQFIAPGNPGPPLDAVTEVLRETGRLAFLRGLVVQNDDLVASFTAVVRKQSQRA